VNSPRGSWIREYDSARADQNDRPPTLDRAGQKMQDFCRHARLVQQLHAAVSGVCPAGRHPVAGLSARNA
jgi:muramidase (phage lysozyme)